MGRFGRLLHPRFTNEDGYLPLTRMENGRRISMGFHVLVCEAFHGPRPTGFQVAHLDGNPANNRADNLAWVTPKENAKHRRLHKTQQCGERVKSAKLTEEQVHDIRRRSSEPNGDLAVEFGVDRSSICRILNYKAWAQSPIDTAIDELRGML